MEGLSETTFSEFLKNNTVALVDFFATWCGPCNAIGPMIEELADEFSGRAGVAKCDIDTAGSVSELYGIRSVPTLIFFRNGQVAEILVGARTKEELSNKLTSLLSSR
jgi:thioredoxin 1